MVLGLRSKHKKGTSVQVDYLIQVQEISPWQPSHSSKASSASSLELQWENGDHSSGSLVCSVAEGKIEFSDPFGLSVTLCKEISKKGASRDSFVKNLLEFHLFEHRKDMSTKGHQLGSAVVNLADYGIVNEGITVSAPVSLRKSSKGAPHPMIFLSIQPLEGDDSNASFSKDESLDKDVSESVSEVTNEEEEIASFTDDDVDDDVSAHSSRTFSSSAFHLSRRASLSQSDKNIAASAYPTGANESPALPSSITASPVIRADEQIQEETTSNHPSRTTALPVIREDEQIQEKKTLSRPSSTTALPVIRADEQIQEKKTLSRPSSTAALPVIRADEQIQEKKTLSHPSSTTALPVIRADEQIQEKKTLSRPSSTAALPVIREGSFPFPPDEQIQEKKTLSRPSSTTALPVIRADEQIQEKKTLSRPSSTTALPVIRADEKIQEKKTLSHPSSTTALPMIRADEQIQEKKTLSCPSSPSSTTALPVIRADEQIQAEKTSNLPSIDEYQTTREHDAKVQLEEDKIPAKVRESDADDVVNTVGNYLAVNGQETEVLETTSHPVEEKLHGEVRRDATRSQLSLRSNTISSNRHAVGGVQGNTRRDKLKQLKSLQIQNSASEIESPVGNNGHSAERVKRHEVAEKVNRGAMITDPGGQREEKPNSSSLLENGAKSRSESDTGRPLGNGHSTERVKRHEVAEKLNRGGMITDQGGQTEEKPTINNNAKSRSEADVVVKKEEPSKLASSESVVKSAVPSSIKTSPRQKRTEVSKNAKTGGNSPSGREETKSVSGNKVEMLEEELMETAALEIGLYSVVAEHGSSANKVHAPARRLSRFYLHTCKTRNQGKRANAARAITSGLILVSKACGNDVPRLTFWLSNSIVLRAIVSQAVEKLNRDPGSSPSKQSKATISDEWENLRTFVTALEKVESWIFSRIVESVWWQTLTPHMQSTAVKTSVSKKSQHARKDGLGDQEQGNFAIVLWQKAFKDSCERLCPIRASRHECGCLHVLARLVMEQLVARLDVAMFNAVLRESADEMPTDPVSDPISDPKVLPIPAGKSSFGAGAQLKNAIGSWSRWLTDLFGIDDSESPEDNDTPFKIFHLLNALSDLMMLPFEMLADQSTRKEVCPTFGPPLIRHVLSNFVPDEFNPDPIPNSILDTLDSEDMAELDDDDETLTSFPCEARATVYLPPTAASVMNTIGGEGGSQRSSSSALQRSRSTLLRKSYTSDDELEDLDSPMNSILVADKIASTSSSPTSLTGKGGRKVVRYQLLREVWKDSQ
ncbi:hypothetical protein LINPERHAP1_LOCUS20381 [Linum perenne]